MRAVVLIVLCVLYSVMAFAGPLPGKPVNPINVKASNITVEYSENEHGLLEKYFIGVLKKDQQRHLFVAEICLSEASLQLFQLGEKALPNDFGTKEIHLHASEASPQDWHTHKPIPTCTVSGSAETVTIRGCGPTLTYEWSRGK